MMNQLPVRQCRHCGGEDIRVGWQSDALVTFKRNGLLGNRIKFLICATAVPSCTSAWPSPTASRRLGEQEVSRCTIT